MKNILTATVSLTAIVLMSASAFAAKPKTTPTTTKPAQKPHEEPAAQYDTNNNGRIDGDEVEAIIKAFAADPNGPLKKYDTNRDGKLSSGEVSAIHFAPKKTK